ncbi:major capsid protein [Lysinibacillus sp. ACHW1.5]|uniref:major capsid protein n=1 Tax=Lysinibacillus sp. ACHW1.5 TaxID=2913506 RepID=UPI001EDB0B59|nr:major capsid protein [Lysinibacillus sp. ACHW1.5]UKJ43460.1 major capsid protein [Lysinibacillus sp. ACHW1.5]
MPDVLELFNQKTMLDYSKTREYKPLLGETLFPEVKHSTLEFDMIKGGSSLPTIASVHAFDTEAEIGSREASKQALEAAYIKRKMQITEKDLIALAQPRNEAEKNYLMQNVFNDVDALVNGVRARVELMRIEALSKGKVTLNENGLNMSVNYHVPSDHQEALSGAGLWTADSADIIGDMERWADTLTDKPTRALTSTKILRSILRNAKIIAALFGKDSGRIPTRQDLNAFLQQHDLPVIAVYDAKYRKQAANGSYTSHRYLDEDKFVMFGDGTLGETLYGPTPEESRMLREGADVSSVGKIITMVFEEGQDPVSTWTKAAATAIPSFHAADNVFQAQTI